MKNIFTIWILVLCSCPSLFGQGWKLVNLPIHSSYILGESQGNLIAGGSGVYYSSDWENFTYSAPGGLSCCYSIANYSDEITFGAFGNRLSKSIDGGRSWHPVFWEKVKKVVKHKDELYCGDRNVFKSTDGGETWNKFIGDWWEGFFIREMFFYKNRIYIHASNNLFSFNLAGQDSILHFTNVNAVQNFENRIFISHIDVDQREVLFSDDGGVKWHLAGENNLEINSFGVNETALFAANYEGLWYTNPYKISWKKLNFNKNCGNIRWIDGILFINSHGSIHKSYDGGQNWEQLYNGIFYGECYRPYLVAGTENFNVMTDGFKNISHNHHERNSNYIRGMFAWYGRVNNKVFSYSQETDPAYTENGNGWINFTVPATVRNIIGHKRKYFLNTFSFSGKQKIYYSDTTKIEWHIDSAISDFDIRHIYSDEERIYAVTKGFLFFSSDEGETWEKKPAPISGEIFTYDGKIIIFDAFGSYISHDEGDNWSKYILGLPSNYIISMVSHKDTMFCINLTEHYLFSNYREWKIFYFDKSDQKWVDCTHNLPTQLPRYYPRNEPINNDYFGWDYHGSLLQLFSDKKNLFFSILSFGVWQFNPEKEAVSIEEEVTKKEVIEPSEEPNKDFFFLIYPNPTTSFINLEINLTKKDNLKIAVFNTMGNRIWNESLLNVEGLISKKIPLEAEPGVYFVEINFNDTKMIKKVVVSQ